MATSAASTYDQLSRRARVARARALQHRRRRLRQAPARQAGDGLGALRRRRRASCTGASSRTSPTRRRTCCASHGVDARRPGRGRAAADARDRRDLLRHLEARRDPALDVGALRRRRDPPPARRLDAEGARHRRAPTPPRFDADAGRRDPRPRRRRCSPARSTDLETARTPPPTTRRSSTTRPARPGWRRASSTPTATSSPTRSSSTATTSRTASASTAWASGPGPPGIAPLLGPWRLGAMQCVYQREGGFDPAKQLDFLSPPRGHERLHDPDRDAGDDGDRRRRRALPAEVPDRLLAPASRSTPRRSAGSASSTGSRCSTTTGSPSPIRCARTSRSWRSARARWAGRCPAGTCRSSTRTSSPVAQGERGEICLRARSNPHYPLGYWNRPEDARGDLRRRLVPHQGRRDAWTRTATSGTPGAPTT